MSSVFSTFFVVFLQQKNPNKINNLRLLRKNNSFWAKKQKKERKKH